MRPKREGQQPFAGIGENNGHYTVRVNWRMLLKNLALPSSMGGVEITRYEVVTVTPQSRE
jgi:hypothetical protein